MTALAPAAAALSVLVDPDAADDGAVLARLATDAPIVRTTAGWVVSGYAEACRLAADRRLTIDPRAGDPPVPLAQSERLDRVFGLMLNFRDGEAHDRLRGAVSVPLAARRLRAVGPAVDAIVGDLVDEVLGRGSFDAVADLGQRLPTRVACALLGLPRAAWPDTVRSIEAVADQLFRFGQTADAVARAEAELDALVRMVGRLAAGRRDGAADLFGSLLGSAGRLSREEFVSFVVLLGMSGLETMTAAVSSCVAALLRWPELVANLRTGRWRAEAVFDEVVRLDSPARMGARRATAPIEVGGHTVRPDEPVFVVWAAANRDPRVFPAPARFVPGRSGRHLAFGHGAHHCLGAALAQRQGAALIRRLVTRAELRGGTGARRRSTAIGGYQCLPVEVVTR